MSPPELAQESAPSKTKTLALMLLLVALIAGLQTLRDDRIAVNGGFGHDGEFYGRLARDLPNCQKHLRNTFRERVHRILPSAVVHLGLRVTAPENPKNITVIRGFQWLNLALLLASVVLWWSIAQRAGFGTRALWFGFISLFLSHQNIKFVHYYPVLTDTTLFFFATLLTFAYQRRSKALMIVVLLLGSFVSSVLFAWIAPLLLFDAEQRSELAPRNNWLASLIAGLAAAILFILIIDAVHWKGYRPPPDWRQLNETLLPLSMLASCAYLFFALRELSSRHAHKPWQHLTRISLSGLAFLVLSLVTIQFITHSLAPRGGAMQSMSTMVLSGYASIPMRSVVFPLIFLVAHGAYWGPIVAVVVWYWRPICRLLHQDGVGATTFMGLTVCLALTFETRHLTPAYPFLVYFAARHVDTLKLPRFVDIGFVLAALVLGRSWLTLGP